MSSGPVEQLRPITWTSSAVSVVSTASMSVPSSILPPCGSSETLAWIGSVRPASLNASRAPKIAAFTSRMSWAVSMMIRSAPPSTSPLACSVKTSTSLAKLMSPRVGSSLAGRKPVGPIEPATKRSSPAALRAISAALVLISTRVLAQAPLVQLEAAALEAVGLDHLGAGLEHRGVDALDHVGAVQHQRLVAFALEAAVIGLGQVELLERRPHPAVENDHAGADRSYEIAFRHSRIMLATVGIGPIWPQPG